MMRFQPRISLTVEHDFFADGIAHTLDFRPDAATAKRLAAPWFAWQARGGRLMIAADAARPPPPDELAVPFRFVVWPTDPLLAAVSEAFLSDGP